MIHLLPRKNALRTDQFTTLEVLLRIDPSQLPPRSRPQRSSVNLGLVLDRSGSMQGEKLKLTLEAACQAVAALDPGDYLSVVTFDGDAHTLYSGYAEDREEICARVRSVEAGGQTALWAGWNRGVGELQPKLQAQRLSRLVVLTDGEANIGETNPKRICGAVAEQAQSGLQTSTLGFGAHYNESLLRSMASSGGGNHSYIENAGQLEAFFAEEMQSLLNARGTRVRLNVTPVGGVRLSWLAEVHYDPQGGVSLADLVEGQPLSLMLRLEVPCPPPPGELLKWELSWHDLDNGEIKTANGNLVLPSVDRAAWDALPSHPEVEMHLALSRAHHLRDQAMKLLELDAEDVAVQWLQWARELHHLPEEEARVLDDLVATVERGDHSASHKKAAMYSHGHGHGHARSSAHYSEPGPSLAVARRQQGKRQRLPLGPGALLGARLEGPKPPWSRVEGLLRGHFYGERLVRGQRKPLGEGASLSLATLLMLLRAPFSPERLAHCLYQAPLLHPTTSQQKFRAQLQSGQSSLLELGSPSAGCAALRRMAPLLVARCRYERDHFYLEAALATALTHRDNLALTSSLGYLAMLWQLLQTRSLPESGDFARIFLEAIQGVACGDGYSCQAPKSSELQGWQGHLVDFLPLALGQARQQALTVPQAFKLWGSGPYLLEVVPSLLYLLEVHFDDPARALQIATQDSFESDTLGMLVGAALGAMHGPQPGWFLHDEIEELLESLAKDW